MTCLKLQTLDSAPSQIVSRQLREASRQPQHHIWRQSRPAIRAGSPPLNQIYICYRCVECGNYHGDPA